MQTKGFLLLIVFYMCSHVAVHAQQERKTLPQSVSDSGSQFKSTGHLLAENITPSVEADVDVKIPYMPIHLAGNKDYFGDKNDYVNNYVEHYLKAHNSTLSYVQARKAKPFQVIDNVLEKKHLPKELKYLAVIESALNPTAVSSVGAVGPWQLMAPTARMLGLSVSRHNDDRTDWHKSTAAATKYLEYLYSEFHDWLLVIAAYNSGPVPVNKAIARTGSHNFWDIKKYLPRETQGHVLAFIATASIFENLSKFIDLGSIPMDFSFNPNAEEALPEVPASNTIIADKPAGPGAVAKPETIVASKPARKEIKSRFTMEELQSMTIVRIKEPIHLGLMAQELGINKDLLVDWNEDYQKFVYKDYPTPFYNLRFPKDKLDKFLDRMDFLKSKSKSIFAQDIR